MEHPFTEDLSSKTTDELQEAITSLNNKLAYAYRIGNNAIIHQIMMLLESYRTQYYKKMDELFSKQNISNQIRVQSGNTDIK